MVRDVWRDYLEVGKGLDVLCQEYHLVFEGQFPVLSTKILLVLDTQFHNAEQLVRTEA